MKWVQSFVQWERLLCLFFTSSFGLCSSKILLFSLSKKSLNRAFWCTQLLETYGKISPCAEKVESYFLYAFFLELNIRTVRKRKTSCVCASNSQCWCLHSFNQCKKWHCVVIGWVISIIVYKINAAVMMGTFYI